MAGDKQTSRRLRMSVLVVLYFALGLVVLFLPAGRLDWWESWIFVAGLVGFTAFVSIWMCCCDTELARERIHGSSASCFWFCW